MAIYRLSNGLVMKATRGRVRTPKACAKQNMPARWISHEVLWSAMRPRIAFRAPKRCVVRCPQRRSAREREQRITNNPPLPLTSILSPWKGEADDKAMRFRVTAQSDLGRFSSWREERGRVRSCGYRASRLLRAKGALSLLAWGNRPRQSIAAAKSAESALQSNDHPPHVASESRFQPRKLSGLPQAANERAPLAQQISTGTPRVLIALVLFAIAPLSISGAAKNRSAMQLPGYRAVSVHYGPMNKMIMSVRINGQPANLLVDTGSNQLILDAEAAELFDVRPSPRGLLYIRSTKIEDQSLPVGFVQNMSAGSMNFGSNLVTLRRSSHAAAASAGFDGVLGLDILFRHKALINCRTKLVFFKVDQTRRINLGSVAVSEKFTRVPIQREETGALTVPCSIHLARRFR
jgi:Aspartyl protease